ncbi:MAG TPA: MoaD/ThiS family protein [Thermoanaerobaculia bacterium]|jgi:molybdopterin synthase catalytic subunit|nr:MoaD/ThiS family protein [Thermoanaerobaculia bacterium]
MRIELLHFASFRDAVGRDRESREIADGTRVRELWASLAREIPLFGRFPTPPPVAVNREYVPSETVLRDGDEVAFLPPVAGG